MLDINQGFDYCRKHIQNLNNEIPEIYQITKNIKNQLERAQQPQYATENVNKIVILYMSAPA